MILLYFLELGILNDIQYNEHKFNIDIKNLMIAVGFTCLIYILLHQINQDNDDFKFKTYNKLIIIFMIIDILLSLFFLSKKIIFNITSLTNVQSELPSND